MNVKELVRAKNMDLLISSHNKEVNRINKDGFINKDSKEIKTLKNRYESLIARFDTDKNTNKANNKHNEYTYNIPLDSKEIRGIRGVKPNIKIRSEN
jgi:hypothetical protein